MSDRNGYRYEVVLVLLAFTVIMVMFIEMMLVPALPHIGMEFPSRTEWIAWILSIYLLVGTVLNPLVGKLGDIHGKKKVLLIVMGIYSIGLLGCSLSRTFDELVIFRAVQGIGLTMFPLAYGIIRDTFPAAKVPVAIGLVSAMFSIGVSIGLLGGGLIVSMYEWRYCYYVVTPLFLFLLPLYYYFVQDGGVTNKAESLDVVGSVTLGASILGLLLALTLWEGEGADLTVAVFGVVFVVAMIAFLRHERRTEMPLIELSLLTGKGAGAHLTAFVFGISMFMLFQIMPYFLMTPESLGGFAITDTFQVGLVMLPVAVVGLVLGPLAGRWCRKYRASVILAIGMGLFALGILYLVALHGTLLHIVVGISIAGVGNAMVMVSMINVVVETTPKHDFGIASGMNTLFRLIGGSIGPVLGTTILAGFTAEVMVAPGVFTTFYTIDGYVWTWAVAFAITALGALAAFMLRTGRRCTLKGWDEQS